jgi:hypothetical protein
MDKRTCNRCGVDKPLTDYYPHKSKQSRCKSCLKEAVSARQKNLTEEQREKRRSYTREWERRQRLQAIEHYGGKCDCCGESRYEFLAIDHIDGGGVRHRREDNIPNIARWLITNNYPDGFRVLCHNCNSAIGFYGYCPHTKECAADKGQCN